MRMFSPVRRKSQSTRLAAARAIEALESRTFLSATLSSPVANVTVTQDSSPTTIDLNAHLADPTLTGTTVIIQTPNGNIPLELFDSVTPRTVQNFLAYVNTGKFNGTIIHRSVAAFVIQGGSFDTAGNPITSLGAIPSEADFPDTRGTIAMALSGDSSGQTDPNSATSGWFINEADNPSLDTSSNGPFTVFGHVIYNGMQIADAINNLPTVPANQLNANTLTSDFPLPVEDPSAGVAATNLVTVNAAVVPHVLAAAISDNPNLVTTSVSSNDQLTLTYASGVSGIAHITVVGTDLGGNSITQTFRVRVTGPAGSSGIVASAGGSRSVIYHQPDGTTVTVSLKGPGTATLTFPGPSSVLSGEGNLVVPGTVLDPDIAITGGKVNSTLVITAKGGSKIAHIGDLTTDADFGTISAATTDLDGDLNAAASVKSITLHGANDGTITLGFGGQTLVFKTSTAMHDEQIHSGGVIRSITTPGWLGTNLQTSGLTALAAGTINVTGNVTSTGFNFTAPHTVNLATLKVKGALVGSTIDAVGNIGAVSAAIMTSDHIFAGVGTLAAGQFLPNFPTDFASVQSIKSVTVKATRTPNFSNIDIAAENLGSLNLGRIQPTNNGVSFGVAGDKISSLTAIDGANGKKLSFHKLDNPAALPALLSKLGFSLLDFVIKVF